MSEVNTLMKHPLLTIFLLSFLFLLLFSLHSLSNASGIIPVSDEGEITVYNDSNRDVYISIAGKNQGTVSAGSSETYSIHYGDHRCEAEWNGGSTYKYVKVSRSDPHGYWYIKKDDVKSTL